MMKNYFFPSNTKFTPSNTNKHLLITPNTPNFAKEFTKQYLNL